MKGAPNRMEGMGLSIGPVAYVIFGIFVTAAAQIFLKLGSSIEGFMGRWFLYLVLSLFCYFLSFICYYLALKHFDISKLSPLMMAGIVSLVTLHGVGVGETLSLLRLIGILLGILSIVLIYRS